MKTTLIVARHGNTFSPGDVVTRVGARTDMPLSTSGLEQGWKLGLYLRDNDLLPDVVFTSALQRTQQTAEQIFAAAEIAPGNGQDTHDGGGQGQDHHDPEHRS